MAKKTYDVNPPPSAYSRLRQQKLPAWQPILTAGTVIPSFFVLGLIFLPIGIGMYVSSHRIQEYIFDYTKNCKNSSSQAAEQVDCSEYVKKNASQRTNKCVCKVDLMDLTEMKGDVFFYYGLSNYYQNHRRYVNSRSDLQLLGDVQNIAECEPFQKNDNGSAYAPCGAIANSIFNDTFKIYLTKEGESNAQLVSLTWEGIAWDTDYRHKFKNPDGDDLQAAFKGSVKPVAWAKPVYQLDPDHPENNGFLNSDLIVWMRTAALPTFRKLYRRLSRSGDFADGLPPGKYTADIEYNYPVESFGGKKRLIVSTASWVGGKNDFLGVAYIVVGCLCIFLGLLFLGIHLKFGKSLTEMSNISGGRA